MAPKSKGGTHTKFWIFSKPDGIPKPPRGIKIVERGILTNLKRATMGLRYAVETIRGDLYLIMDFFII